MKKQWEILKPDPTSVAEISRHLGCSPITAKILMNRKIDSLKDAVRFLNPSLSNIRPPFSIKDMDLAVKRIFSAFINNEKILIFGDYDVDGITSTAILYEFFREAGANVSYYIPHRTKEGYGMQISHILGHALPDGINLIVTVDCGSGCHEAVKAAQETGIDVIITDHHRISETRPSAVAVVNPKRYDCKSGFDDLAGVGVAFCLLVCLRKHMRDMNFWKSGREPNLKNFCDLVALGTLADIVPLANENRILAKTGLGIISSGNRPGLRALMEQCGITRNMAETEDIVFKLAPRLNAAGRMDHAKTALELLISNNLESAEQIAQSLNEMNSLRQATEKNILDDIHQYINSHPNELQNNALILFDQKWHEGVLGIVASKLAEKYFRPVVLITMRNGVGRGSARSIPGFDLYEGLRACSSDLEDFGGHSMAAGLKMNLKYLERFKEDFESTIRKTTRPNDFIPKICIDCELDFEDISPRLIDEMDALKPFGAGNEEPLFMARNIKVSSSKIVGRHHRRMRLTQVSGDTGQTLNAIHFNIDPVVSHNEHFDRIAFRLRWNRWNGRKTPQIVIEET
ncbi:MAG TPA: single-stranded-DNA-specific exonuclease RecJ [Desulfobacterales bacterium]|nr:single-stranded-DNA-specific exonuclease RecJ [Desulfobacterales bacterium]